MKLYKGRIPEAPDPLMDQINRSLPFDIRLLPYDVATNRAWADELFKLGIFSRAEVEAVHLALSGILERFERGAFDPIPEDEDVHTLVERLLTEELGSTGARIHTGRSRNDQVVCDLRLYTREGLDRLSQALRELIAVLNEKAAAHADSLMAGTTHLQPALPITLGHLLLSLAFALKRDHERLQDARKRVNLCPLGAGAMAGSGFAVDRQALCESLGFEEILHNSIDAVSDRDFCQETAQACADLAVHLSRYAEQLILWANPAFGYVRFSDRWSTGSSMMPQKRNPDAMELVRGKSAAMIGAVTSLLTLTKGLPLSYAKDLQEDKRPLFEVLDTALLIVRVFTNAVREATFIKTALAANLSGDMLATDLADALVLVGIPFRQAHERVARFVTELEQRGDDLARVEARLLTETFPEFGEDPPELSFAASVARRRVAGGTAVSSVTQQIALLKGFLEQWPQSE